MAAILNGIRVLETASFVSGPYVGQLLADLGAEVIKIENPETGDPFRSLAKDGYSADFFAYNTNKKSVGIDLTKDEGSALLKRLAQTADVLIENFRPGVMDRLKLGWPELKTLNPRLIYCSVTGFGDGGPYRHRPAYDSVAGAMSGFFSQILAKNDPQILGPALCDAVTGLYGAYAILGGLIERQHTHVGRKIDVNMLESMIGFLRQPFMRFFFTGRTPDPLDRPAQSMCFSLRCADDRLVAIHLSTLDKFWASLLAVVERRDLEADGRFATGQLRRENYRQLGRELSPIFATKKRADWMALLDRFDVPFAPVNDFDDVMADPQVAHLEIFRSVVDNGKPITTINSPAHYDGDRPVPSVPAPRLGAHTTEILSQAGLSADDISRLRASAVIY